MLNQKYIAYCAKVCKVKQPINFQNQTTTLRNHSPLTNLTTKKFPTFAV